MVEQLDGDKAFHEAALKLTKATLSNKFNSQ